jgi:TonB family protein
VSGPIGISSKTRGRPVHVGVWIAAAALACAVNARAFEGNSLPPETPPPKKPQLTRPPELLHFVDAAYPEEARKEGLSGDVRMIITIDEKGTVTDASVTAPAGHGFDEAAIAAVKQFEFSPAEVDGKPAAIQIEYVYHFFLQQQPKAQAAAPEAPVTLKGTVRERGTKRPIAGASVRCVENPEVVETGAEGKFELHAPPGVCSLEITSAAHRKYTTKKTVVAGQVVDVTCFLMPKTYGMFETVVRAEEDEKEVTRYEIQREEVENVPGTLGDPVRVLETLPGVARAPFNSGELVIRGAAPDDTNYYLDGVQIPLLFHLLGGPSVVNPEFIDKIDFYPGGFGARYGNATGGTIDISTRKPESERLRGELSIDTLQAAAFVAAPLPDGFSVTAAARRSYIDSYLPWVLKTFLTSSVDIVPAYYDYQLRVDKADKGSPNTFSLMFFGSDDALKIATSGLSGFSNLNVDYHTHFDRLRLAWNYRSEDFALTVAPYAGYGTDVISIAGENINVSEPSGGLRADASYTLGHQALRFGLDFSGRQDTYSLTLPGNDLAAYNYYPGEAPSAPPTAYNRQIGEYDWGVYVELDFQLGRLRLIPGVRADLFRVQGSNREDADPRFTVRYSLTDSTTLKGSAGLYHRSPDPQDLDPLFGSPNLLLIAAFQASAGVEQKFSNWITAEVVGFYTRRFDEVVATDSVLPGTYLSNDGVGRAYGLEVLLRHEVSTHFFGWLAYTLSRSEDRAPGGPYILSGFDETHILSAVAQYRIAWGVSVGARFQLTTGLPTTPYTGSTFDADTNLYAPISGVVNSTRLPTFQELDVRIDKEFVFDWWSFMVYLEIWNVYNAHNEEAVEWDYRYRQVVYVPGIPFLPILGIKGKF